MTSPSPQRLIARVLLVWAVEAAGLLLAAWVLPGVEVDGPGGAVTAVAVIGLLNALLYPVLISALASIAALTFGLLGLVLNAAVVLLAGDLLPGFHVHGFGSALVLVLVLTLVNVLASAALALDDDNSFHRGVVLRTARRARRRAGDGPADRTPGILFLEIDGLSEDVLRRALADRLMPNLAGWLERGSHEITSWECDLSSQTSASQAGLLHGHNENIPAFRWYDREAGRAIVSAKPADAALIERRASDGAGLLADGGASRGNLLTGDAPHVAITISGVGGARAQRADRAAAWRAYLTNPYNVPRTLLLFVADVAAELRAARRQRRDGTTPRVHRGGKYPLLRAATTSFLVDATVNMLIGDVFRGVPAAYATFVGYDEVAHHSGIAAPDALGILRRLDRQFGRIAAATRLAPRPYEIVVLSDHGQSEGATFLQRHGRSLQEVTHDLAGSAVAGAGGSDAEAGHHLSLALGEAADDGPRATAWAARRANRGVAPDEPELGTQADVLVFGSGNLGLIYFPARPERMTLEEIEAAYPDLVDGLAAHPGVGAVCVISDAVGPVVVGADGRLRLDGGAVAGVDPLAVYGPRAAAHVARELSFANAPDLLVLGAYDPEVGEVGAFEELVGSHGGLGGPQARPFVLHPVRLRAPDAPLVGAAAVHHLFKGWLAQVRDEDAGHAEASVAGV